MDAGTVSALILSGVLLLAGVVFALMWWNIRVKYRKLLVENCDLLHQIGAYERQVQLNKHRERLEGMSSNEKAAAFNRYRFDS